MDWNHFRALFPTTRRWAFFDHAAVSPLPSACVAAMKEYADDLAINGVLSFERWSNRIEAARHSAGQLLQADPLDIAFVPNTTAGIGFIAEGFPWQPGDNVVTAAEHAPGSGHAFECTYARGATGCEGGTPARHAFDLTESLYVEYWVKYAPGFVGSGKASKSF